MLGNRSPLSLLLDQNMHSTNNGEGNVINYRNRNVAIKKPLAWKKIFWSKPKDLEEELYEFRKGGNFLWSRAWLVSKNVGETILLLACIDGSFYKTTSADEDSRWECPNVSTVDCNDLNKNMSDSLGLITHNRLGSIGVSILVKT